jgi:hypothetical protein
VADSLDRGDLRLRRGSDADGGPAFELARTPRGRSLAVTYEELRWLCLASGPAMLERHRPPAPERPAPAPLAPPAEGEVPPGELHS